MSAWLFELLRELKIGQSVFLGQSLGPERQWMIWNLRHQAAEAALLGHDQLEVESLLNSLPPGGAVFSGSPEEPVLWERIDARSKNGAVWSELSTILEQPVTDDYNAWLLTSAPDAPPGIPVQIFRHLIISRDDEGLIGPGPSPPGQRHTFDLLYSPSSLGRLIIIGLDRLAHLVAELARKCGLSVMVVAPDPLLEKEAWAGFDLKPLSDWAELKRLKPDADLSFRKQDFYLITAAEADFMKSALAPFTSSEHTRLITDPGLADRSSAALHQSAVQLIAEFLAMRSNN